MADCCVDCLRSLLMRPPPLLLALAREREVGVVLLLVTDTAGRADGAEEDEASLSSLSLSVDSECCGCECDTAGEAERRGAAAAAAAAAHSARKLTGISGEIHEAVPQSRTGQRSRIVEMTDEREIDGVEHEGEQQSESVWSGEFEQLDRLQLWHVSQQRVEKAAAGEAARSDAKAIAGGSAEGCLARIEYTNGVCRCDLVAIGRVIARRVPVAQPGVEATCCRAVI